MKFLISEELVSMEAEVNPDEFFFFFDKISEELVSMEGLGSVS